MERFGGGFKKGARGLTTFDKGNGGPAQGKLKLRTSKDPLPLLRQSNRDTKPKAKFLLSVGGGVPIEKSERLQFVAAHSGFMVLNAFLCSYRERKAEHLRCQQRHATASGG